MKAESSARGYECTLFSSFLRLERELAGWRFWLLWVLATNVGFFPGLALGSRISTWTVEPFSAAIVGASFGGLVGVV